MEVGVIGGKPSLLTQSANEDPDSTSNSGVCRYCSLSITTSQPPPPNTASSSASASSNTTTNKPPIPTTSSRRESYSWRATQAKLKQLEKQWTESTRAAHQAANPTPNPAATHPSSTSSSFVNMGNRGASSSSSSSSASCRLSTGSNSNGGWRRGSASMADKARTWVSTMTTGHQYQTSVSTNNEGDDVDRGSNIASAAEIKRELSIFASSLHNLEDQLHHHSNTNSWTCTLESLRQVKNNTMKLCLLLSSQVHSTMSLPSQEEDRGPAVLRLIHLVSSSSCFLFVCDKKVLADDANKQKQMQKSHWLRAKTIVL